MDITMTKRQLKNTVFNDDFLTVVGKIREREKDILALSKINEEVSIFETEDGLQVAFFNGQGGHKYSMVI